jgi:osmotically-inducible protein OsmY
MGNNLKLGDFGDVALAGVRSHQGAKPRLDGIADEPEDRFLRERDEKIRLAVTTALFWDLAVPRHRVIVRVDRGWVTLTGRVELAYQKSCAEADARSTSGVSGVTNEIELGTSWPGSI